MGDDDVARHAVLSGGLGSCIMTVATVVSGECIVSGIPHTTKHRLSGSVSLHCPKYLCNGRFDRRERSIIVRLLQSLEEFQVFCCASAASCQCSASNSLII